MDKDAHRLHQYHLDQIPPNPTPSSASSSQINLPPITSLTGSAVRSRTPIASTSTPVSSPSLSHSSWSRSSGAVEPLSPANDQPLLSPSGGRNESVRSVFHLIPHQTHMSVMSQQNHSSTDSYYHSHHHSTSSQHTRPIEDGSHLWGDGMKGIWNSLTGAPYSKSRSPPNPSNGNNAKGEHLEPARPSQVEAATSIWDIPRETVAMTMGFQGNLQDQSYQSQQAWQPQQMSTYSGGAEGQQPSYSNAQAPSGLAGATGDSTRPRGVSDSSASSDRHYARRPNYQHGPTDASNSSQWWSTQSNAPAEDSSATSHYGARRLQPPPLPETRSASRPNWSNSGNFEIGSYEFPQTSLGKRQYDEEAMGVSSHGSAVDSSDSAARRYSLAPNMSFSRPSAPISSMMNSSYRPAHNDPRRPSLPSDPYGVQQQAPAGQRAGYPTSSQWSPWSGGTSHSGMPGGGMSTSGSSPNLSGWRDGGVARHGIEASYLSPSGMPGADKRQSRDRSSSTASNVQQANPLANTPFHITTDIVLRAPAGSKMEDVYYDQHCELRTGMADPPASDFEVENEEDRPRLQTDKLRFPGDLYTPRWVRGAGNAREAWCDRCESGNWLQLKNSQYWYDQVHKHGISSVSGLRFTAPTHLKVYADAAGTVEGKCHQCKEWVLICTAKRRRNFAAFFKHAHACHSYRKASTVGNGPFVEHNPGGHRTKKNGSPI